MGQGILSDLKEKIEDKEINFSVSLDDVEVKLPFSDRTIIRLGGNFKLDRLRIGWGQKKKRRGGKDGRGRKGA